MSSNHSGFVVYIGCHIKIYWVYRLSLHVLLESSESVFGLVKHVVILADSKSQPIFDNVSIVIGEELGRWNGSDTKLLDDEVREFEIARTACDMLREGVVSRKLYFGHIHEDEVTTFGVRIRQFKFIEDSDEAVDLGSHFSLGLIPKAMLISFLEADSSSFLQRADTAVADSGVSSTDGLNKMLGANQPPNAPSGAVEVLASRANSKCEVGDLGRKSSHAGEGSVIKTIVDLVAQNNNVVLDAQVTDSL